MSTSDSEGKEPLTRKQLREIRLTGATPVITEEEAAAAAPAPVPAPPLPRAADAAQVAPAPTADESVDLGALPLTRRQAREQERIRTASVPVIGAEEAAAAQTAAGTDAAALESEQPDEPAETEKPSIVSAVPVFAPVAASAPADEDTPTDADGAADAEIGAEADGDALSEASPETGAADGERTDEEAGDDASASAEDETDEPAEAELAELGVDADAIEHVDDPSEQGERPTVNPTFGQSVLSEQKSTTPFTPSFDELITAGDSTGSQHIAPSALIFNPPPGDGSLSGPVASTGEILVTGSYDLPEGLGSQGHAKGTTDGKDVDAVLIDGELPPASSPTPIAASSAISTIKPAGEVIRPPAPEKGNKLMLILAITAGGLALALAAALIIAFTMNVL
ncbi:hypothetical protein M2317_003469 [Microbacterium sp. ZKA21]|uniref:hypothetical protein n=1 Tax=Microbacterium sp. ZKA21 TaxID=3381694 RepID=UPI003D1ADBCB